MARNEVPLDVFWLRIVQQRQNRLAKRTDLGMTFIGATSQQVKVLVPHMRTFARTEPRVCAASAQPLYRPSPI